MEFETVIGLEVHVELKTKSKVFCHCSTEFGAPPNTNVCPICLAHPGTLPVLNTHAVELAMKAAMALNCEIADIMTFDRKHYFYPDLPRAYQITQNENPIGRNGWVEIEVNGKKKKIGIHHIHLEEDAGKLMHAEDGNYSLVDLNRAGMPLIEIVSEPDMRSPEEAYAYLEKLKAILQYTGVSDVKMEEGSLRCDANVSLRPVGQKEFGTKTEIKNLNSFAHVRNGIAYEEIRQAEILREGGVIRQETRRYDEATKRTVLMRVKETADDYRYYPDPDLLTVEISEEWKNRVRSEIPELPDARRARYINELGLPEYDAKVLTQSKELSDYYEEVVKHGADAKLASNWMMGEVSAYLNAEQKEITEVAMKPESLAKLIKLIENGTISSKIAKQIFEELIEKGGDPEVIVKEKGLMQISDEGELRKLVIEIIENNEQSVQDFKNGKERALGFLVGQAMKATKGKANPQLINKLLKEEIAKR